MKHSWKDDIGAKESPSCGLDNAVASDGGLADLSHQERSSRLTASTASTIWV